MIINLFVLCEGQTEEAFVKRTLHDYLEDFGIKVIARVAGLERKSQGGISHYSDVARDIKLMVTTKRSSNYERNYFTTMFDYYALPSDFPGKADAAQIKDVYPFIEHVEKCLAEDMENRVHCSIIPYIQLHEFESLVFAGLDELKFLKPQGSKTEKAISNLKEELRKFCNNPELVNSNYHKAPSRRLMNAFENFAPYSKIHDGNDTVELITIPVLKTRCRHFGEWIDKLEKLGIPSKE